MSKIRGSYLPPDGRLRLSQVVSTHGPGAMLDLVDSAALVSGLDHWKYQSSPKEYVIDLPRLRERVVRSFKKGDRAFELDREGAFRTAPAGDESNPSPQNGIPVFEFPTWFVCQNPACKALMRATDLDWKGDRRRHLCGNGKSSPAVPVRFVRACPAGHLDDVSWRIFVHFGRDACEGGSLTFVEGRTGDFSELEVHCSCGAKQKMMTAYDLPQTCSGKRPWLGKDAGEPCEQQMRLLIRTASHGYFPQVMSALAIPEEGMELRDKLETVWDTAKNVKSAAYVGMARDLSDKFRMLLEDYSDEDIWKAIVSIKDGKAAEREPLRTAEFKRLCAAPPEQVGDLPPPPGADYFARRVPRAKGLPSSVAQIVLAHRLRVVSVQVGFTRLDAQTADLEGELSLGVTTAALTLHRRWLPATEARGEGVFIQLDPGALEAWEARKEVQERARCLEAGYQAWVKKKAPDAPEFLGIRYYLLHSLSHLLMSAVALECGYSGSALQERIYCSPKSQPPTMAGILISTGTPGSEGSLGGLVDQGRVLDRHLERALHLGRLCSNDPVCASHDPETDPTERHREGAACHGCLFVAEPSCERFNQYLDRALVVPTIGHPGVAFFG